MTKSAKKKFGGSEIEIRENFVLAMCGSNNAGCSKHYAGSELPKGPL